MPKDLQVMEWSEEDIQQDGERFCIPEKECNVELGRLKFDLKIQN